MRDYGTGEWDGGDEGCDHKPRKFTDGCIGCGAPMHETTEGCGHCEDRMLKRSIRGTGDKRYKERDPSRPDLPNPPASWAKRDATVRDARDVCACGARRVDRQLGLEPTPDQYVTRMVEVFREIRRVLASYGTCWVNLGDSYASAWACDRRNVVGAGSLENGKRDDRPNRLVGGLKEKDLVGIPWRVAFALQADGWWLRSDIIWAKPNPMPESVTDRPTKAHEYVFLLTRGPRYWFDQEAVRERYEEGWKGRLDTSPASNGRIGGPGGFVARGPDGRRKTTVQGADGSIQHRDGERWPNGGRNVRSVWEIATQPYPEAHFATFPEELARRCIVAGCPEWVCRVCHRPRERIVERESNWQERREAGAWAGNVGVADNYQNNVHGAGMSHDLGGGAVRSLGWSDCGHNNYRPGVVLDPFGGSGTVAHVARKHGRRAVLIELNETYCQLIARRTQQQSLLA